ncbi:MAG TPA: flavodoxin/ferredoxin-dependent (E)-4-hydroxy-3-methylbut-2-enyl-diphosphate synthase [Oligoflexia bacterium]|nr:flavodoxin/ferredoxin-dependent (E)-4-hydroxy-3-methylbut-2-enyl-diphosphate synthase [Oligoflexia bacterium]HMP47131.1 flavodoxin/ferredoxin-dependent (E)-4-hydroxy-3-methylbut-2-enyl-diphosphate synthase [Oligoflexia bacterium]
MIRRVTRAISVGSTWIGGTYPITVQSMCATRTTDLDATISQIKLLKNAGADIIRVAVDSKNDVEALREISSRVEANFVVDLQENYRLAKDVAPFVAKFRYNPGHLHHHQKQVSVEDKVRFLVDVAGENDCAIRIGVNFGSLDPVLKEQGEDSREVAYQSAVSHMEYLEKNGFTRYVVSLKSSSPDSVVEINRRFAAEFPLIPLHLGVTEAGLLPNGEIKTRIAFEQLLSEGIGETLRVSLTLPDNEKDKEILIAKKIISDIESGRFRSVPKNLPPGLNVISCPSCSRVENKAFVDLAYRVKESLEYAEKYNITVAVMGCRVNGPGETDEADLGLWCAPTFVNLKKGSNLLGKFSYDEVVDRLKSEVDQLIIERA